MKIGVPAEVRPGETRVAASPETVKKLVAGKHTVIVQSGAGVPASFTDEAFAAAGATIGSPADALGADLVLKVRTPLEQEFALMKRGAVLVGMLEPFNNDGIAAMNAAGLTAFALEAAPRTTRAQSMDVLSSQANIAGYKAVLMAANVFGKLLPMMMTAAGTIKAGARADPRRRRGGPAGDRHRQAPRRGGRGLRRASRGQGADRVARRQVRRRAVRDRRGARDRARASAATRGRCRPRGCSARPRRSASG